MKRGPKPKSDKLKALQGNLGGRAVSGAIVQIASTSNLEPPDWLHDVAKAEWWRVVKVLSDAGLYTDCERMLLANYCEMYAQWRALTQVVWRDGHSIDTEKGVIANPDSNAFCRITRLMNDAMKELGLTPNSRSRLRGPTEKEKKVNKFAELHDRTK